ncbi:hypothetical protein [Mycolicibacterium sphagni]|uniref:Uncharacterized protein n=1 Tax=Mycolicibacterium sphagni TaxID=1786 RepID=A0A255DPJ2_9MYCO|nr:hypothetical protein [Mycolicibacterium sphagni]OYN78892.1 hypothetical protein CG716_13565 [Mycolicibacterium sphagni]
MLQTKTYRHTVWCSSRPDERHDDETPYCESPRLGARLIPDVGDLKAQVWVSPISAATEGMSRKEADEAGARYDGVQIAHEAWDGTGWREQYLRMAASEARGLAAALIRAADIEQGLTR